MLGEIVLVGCSHMLDVLSWTGRRALFWMVLRAFPGAIGPGRANFHSMLGSLWKVVMFAHLRFLATVKVEMELASTVGWQTPCVVIVHPAVLLLLWSRCAGYHPVWFLRVSHLRDCGTSGALERLAMVS